MLHFIYKTESKSGKYYIGRHSSEDINDGYIGSGKWVRSIKDKSELTRTILEFCESVEELKELEKKLLKEHVGKEDCMNFNLNSCGFSTGDLNPSSTEEGRKRISERLKIDNPSKNPEVAKKISRGNSRPKGKWETPMSEEGRKNISKGRTGLKYSEEGKERLKTNRKETYKRKGTSPFKPTFEGLTHKEETLKKMRESHKKLPLYECTHCGVKCKIAPFNRWHDDNCKHKKYEDYAENERSIR